VKGCDAGADGGVGGDSVLVVVLVPSDIVDVRGGSLVVFCRVGMWLHTAPWYSLGWRL